MLPMIVFPMLMLVIIMMIVIFHNAPRQRYGHE